MSKLIRLTPDETVGVFQSGRVFSVVDLGADEVIASGNNLETLLSGREWETPSLTAAGSSWRRRKAERQPRDFNGRFIGAGANAKWKSHGTEWTGTVRAIRDGKAIVDVRLPNGSVTQRTIEPNSLRLYSSKARIPSSTKVQMEDEDFDGFIARYRPRTRNPEDGPVDEGTVPVEEGTTEEDTTPSTEQGGSTGDVNVTGTSPSGYSIDLRKQEGEENAMMFQLYAPSSQSMGIFTVPADGVTNANDTVESHRESTSEESPESAPDTVVSSGYEVPDSVRINALSFLEKHQENLTEEQLNLVASLANKESVGEEIIQTIKDFFFELDELTKMYGGVDARDWSNDVKDHKPHDFDREDNIDYFAISSDEYFSDVYLIAVDKFTGNVLGWENGSFSFDLGNMDTFESENIIPLDKDSAKEVALQLENTSFSLKDISPEERNLFTLAQDEMDFGELDRIATLAYDGADRSYDAKTQSRSAGGKFVEAADMSKTSSDVKYFAIVDSADQEAVLDVVAVQNKGGAVTVFKREGGLWVASPELQAQIQGATPPAVSVLSDENTLKDVLSQVDDYDLENGAMEEALTASAIFRDEDLELYIQLGGKFSNYVYNRAKALNRLDLVPEDWRLQGAYSTDGSLFGEYGEVITASGFGADTTNLEKLESYWLKGKGSEKISWGTDFAVSDGYKVFSKFLGTQRAFAFATILNNKYSGA